MLQTAVFTVGLSGVADGPAVEHDAMAKVGAVLGRQDLAQCHLNFHRVLGTVHQPQAVGNADTVGIRHDSTFFIKIPKQKICYLAPYTAHFK